MGEESRQQFFLPQKSLFGRKPFLEALSSEPDLGPSPGIQLMLPPSSAGIQLPDMPGYLRA